MKPSILSVAGISFPLASAIAALLTAQSAQAINYYWDGNNNSANFGTASGIWAEPTTGTATSGWTTDATGATAISGNSITTLLADVVNFGTDTTGRGLGTGTIAVSGTVDATQLRFGNQTTGNITLSGGTINLAAVANLHTGAGGTTNHNITSIISGASTSLTKTGNILTLSGANTYTGTTIISTGNLILNNLSALGSTTGVTIGGAATATLSSSLTGITVTAPITTANSGINSNISFSRNSAAVGSIDLNGAISGAGNVIFTTPNVSSGGQIQTINLGAAGTYLGSTTITTGNVNNSTTIRNNAGVANVLPTATVLTMSGGTGTGSGRTVTFDLNGQNQELAGLTNVTAADRNQRVTSATAATLTINNSADFTFGNNTGGADPGSGQITGAIALTKKGAGTFTLAAGVGHTFTGKTVVEAGILSVGHVTSLQSSAYDTAGSIMGDATNGLRSTVTTLTLGGLTGNKNFADVFTSTSGGYTGLTALTLNPGASVTHSYSADIGDGATGMNLTKTGAGTQTLTGISTHTGSTTVSAGVLAVNGSLANTSTTTVSGTGTLKGSGSINSSVTINSGGTLASGTSIESLATGALSFTTGSNFEYELDADPAEQGDLTAVTGDLSLAGTVTLSFLETGSGSWELGTPLGDHFGITPADKLTLISYSGTWNGGLFTYLGSPLLDDSYFMVNGQQWFFNYNDTDAGTNFVGDLTGTRFVTMTVPEPRAALLGGLGLLILLRRRR